MGSILKNIIILLGLGMLLFLGYYLFVIESDSTISNSSVSLDQANLETQNFLRKLQRISTLDLSKDIFNDSEFSSFVDFSLPIESVPVGRENPFVE